MESQLLEHNFVVSQFPSGQKNVTTPFCYLHLTFLFFISFMTFKKTLILKLRKSSLMASCSLILWLSWSLLCTILMFFYNKQLFITSIWKPFKIFVKHLGIRNKCVESSCLPHRGVRLGAHGELHPHTHLFLKIYYTKLFQEVLVFYVHPVFSEAIHIFVGSKT